MKPKETKQTAIIELDKIDPLTLPELASFKEKSLTVVKENPYVEIIDNSTYELAKKARTNLRSNRTELQKQEKAIKDKLNGFKKKVENVTAELIAITEPHEIKQQSEVTRYEDIKEQERQEKLRIEQERIDGIKTKIKSFADLFNSKIQSLTFAGIDDFKAEFDEFVNVQPKEVFEEFEVLYNDMLSHVTYSFSQKKATLIAQEENRLEQVRLAEERAENERKLNIRNGIQSWFNNWSATIDSLSFFNHSGYFEDFKNEKAMDCQEFQSEYAEIRNLLIQKFESKIALLNQIEETRIAAEKLAKEKAEFEEKQLEAKYQERKKFLVDEDYYRIYLLAECGEEEDVAKGKLLNYSDKSFEDFKKAVLKAKEGFVSEQQIQDAAEEVEIEGLHLLTEEGMVKAEELENITFVNDFTEIEVIEPVVEDDEDFDFNKSYEDAIENLNELTEDSEAKEFDFEKTWESIYEDFENETGYDEYNATDLFLSWLKENFEVPKRLIK